MQSNINEILKKIEALQKDLSKEYEDLLKKYSFQIKQGKIEFIDSIRKKNLLLKQNLLSYIFTADFRNIISMPFIYSMIIPMVLLDIFLFMYQTICFPLYRIPKAKRSDYITFDRRFLNYLNLIQKINCLYCSYGNGVFNYAVEIAARTERYWCPIKSATKPRFTHGYYSQFADYGDANGFIEVFNKFETQENENTQK